MTPTTKAPSKAKAVQASREDAMNAAVSKSSSAADDRPPIPKRRPPGHRKPPDHASRSRSPARGEQALAPSTQPEAVTAPAHDAAEATGPGTDEPDLHAVLEKICSSQV